MHAFAAAELAWLRTGALRPGDDARKIAVRLARDETGKRRWSDFIRPLRFFDPARVPALRSLAAGRLAIAGPPAWLVPLCHGQDEGGRRPRMNSRLLPDREEALPRILAKAAR
jgi:hypothetical protein